MSKVSALARQGLLEATRDRYLASSPSEKRGILDEFVALTGYHRKHAIRVLRSPRPDPLERSPRARVYDDAVRDALVVLWEASDRPCGKRLRPLLPVLLPALEHHGHLSLDEVVRGRVLAASAATIDRLLAEARAQARDHRRNQRARPRVSRRAPARARADGKQPEPGYVELDLVAHRADDAARGTAHTLVLTDIASGWTEYVALPAGEPAQIVDGLERLRTAMPFPLRGITVGKDSELVTDTVRTYCGKHQIELLRSPLRRKADQVWIARQTRPTARRIVSQDRLEHPHVVEALEQLYAASRLFVNFFQPSFKLVDKQRVGARVRKRYRSPQTPCARLLASPVTDEATRQQLGTLLATLDPRDLLHEIRAAQRRLAALSTGDVRPGAPLVGPKPPRPWRTRADPFAEVWPRVVIWLETEPDRTAKELLERLRDQGLGAFPDGQLRTFQRRVKAWRRTTRPVRSPGGPR